MRDMNTGLSAMGNLRPCGIRPETYVRPVSNVRRECERSVSCLARPSPRTGRSSVWLRGEGLEGPWFDVAIVAPGQSAEQGFVHRPSRPVRIDIEHAARV